jgi:hypothetical protein
LETTPNQMQFITDNFINHLMIGQLSVTQLWLDYAETPKVPNFLQFDTHNLRFVDLLTLDKEKAFKWLISIIELNIRLS